MTTCPDPFHRIHLGRCRSTNDYIKENFQRLEKNLPLVVGADCQLGGRGREGRGWFSAEGLGIYATFAFVLSDNRRHPFLSIAAGVAVADMLAAWSGRNFSLKWPNDVQHGGKKIAGILCETMVYEKKITCLVGIGINLNHREEDFPEELRVKAASLRTITGVTWPVAEGRERLAAGMATGWQHLEKNPEEVLDRARFLTRSFMGRKVSFHQQGREWRGTFLGLASDGGLVLGTADGEKKVHYSGEIIG